MTFLKVEVSFFLFFFLVFATKGSVSAVMEPKQEETLFSSDHYPQVTVLKKME